MPDVHARFSPSSAEQFINCPPSLVLEEQCNIADETSEYAAEGTEAHTLCEYLIRTELGEQMEDPRPGLSRYGTEMQECAEGYRNAVMEIYKPGDFISVEQRVYLDDYVPGSFGTSDCVIIGDGHMHVIDFKYGIGVKVSAEDNAQLKCYALGAYLAFSPLYDIREISLVIYQPRISNYSSWSLTAEELLNWGENTLKPKAELALKGEGEFSSGSWCKWCKAKPVCRKLAEVVNELAKHEFAEPPTLTDEEINDALLKVETLNLWVKAVQDYALQRALSGHKWKDWKVVEGQSKRKYKDEAQVAETVIAAGYDPYEKKLIGLTAMKKMLGKEKFSELVEGLTVKPKGKPELVLRSDKREEIFEEECE